MTTTEGISIPGVSVGGPGAGAADRTQRRTTAAPRPVTALWQRPAVRAAAVDTIAVVAAVLDVWLMWQIFPADVVIEPYSVVLSAVSCAALLARRWLPFTALVITVPGFFAGWAQLAAMIALGYLATRKQTHWQVWVGAGLIWLCRFVLWPLPDFIAMTWQEHALDAIYGVIVAGMPVAIGLLIGARTELSARLTELAASRDRERRLHAQAVRAEERARLAREMHDVVSHDITLIAMQASALSVTRDGDDMQRTARTIRQLSTNTLEELRSLVGVLRSGALEEGPRHDLADLDELVRSTEVPVTLDADRVPGELPPQVSAAAYRTVQECLTNVRKHAPGATALVRLAGEPDGLVVEVRNDRPTRGQGSSLPSGGYGLTGLAERARLLGGTFETGPTDDGGFRVRARYPVTG
ncbi:sensor histidine kinase [Prauserella muralis]|uniref:histidine kinase n=1 Tax=Prauserella muralis TaxID=588067 RepID=A0A2V4AHE2_9PSEU|nr:sensor histidine kinase [Prauserella muralis]PXY19141.1 histidine kinase [Prauserella muralis]TWE29050.1 signal transduction histidine kinase [Prauserella muralis]